MSKVTITLDTEEIQPLVALCKNQMDLINDLHARVNSIVMDIRVKEMKSSIEELRIDEHVTYIQHEAFKAGFSANNEGVISYDKKDAEDAFNEWLKERDE